MLTIRLYTEDKNRDRITTIVGEHFEGFSLIPCEGVWHGTIERGLIVEIASRTPVTDIPLARLIAQEIKAYNTQEAVLMTITKSDIEYL